MAFDTAAGATLSVVAGAPATVDATGFSALTFVLIGEVENIGEFGKEYNLVTFLPLAQRGASKVKGSFNNGRFEPQLALDAADAGQVIMLAALESDLTYSFEVALTGGEVFYFQGLVMKFAPVINTVDDIVRRSAIVEVSRDLIVEA
jgi:hypothetical protein